LAEAVRINHEKSPAEIVKSVSASLADFIGRVRPHDDRTMIVVKMGEQ
jgi:serine phosphatase RsbU (regulator of sigma subunit)